MPTAQKASQIEELKDWIGRCSIAISTDYSGLPVSQMTDLRRALRDKGLEYHVIKNTLAFRAADEVGRPALKQVVQGPTGVVFGYQEPTDAAKALADFIRTSRSNLKIVGGLLGDRALKPSEVETLATLPSKQELIARLLGQMQGPITSLVYVLNGPLSAFARVLQRRAEQMSAQG